MSGLVTQTSIAGPIVANERLWLTADGGRVVSEGDPEATMLLAAAGHTIPRAVAERLGLVDKTRVDEPRAEGDAAPELAAIKYRELRKMAAAAHLSTSGSRADLIARLENNDAEAEGEG